MNSLTQVHISNGSDKLRDIPSVNVSSLENEFCKAASLKKGSICNSCYSNRLTKMRKNLEKRLLDNTELLGSRLLEECELPRFNNRFVRFNSFGEIYNDIHMQNLIAIAKANPYTNFGLWSKRSDIVMKYKKLPNIKYIFSVSGVDGKCTSKKILDFFDKVFIAISNKEEANCFGACVDCLLCYTDNDVKVIKEKKK